MKWHYKIELFQFILFLISINLCTPNDYSWDIRSIAYRGVTLKLIILKNLDSSNVPKMLELIDRSSEGKYLDKVPDNYNGLIRENDILCINEKLIFWFSATEKKKRSVRTGGGLLSGIWELRLKENKVELKSFDKNSLYSPNLLLPGSTPGVKLFGADIYGGYTDKKVIWGLENAMHLKEGTKMGHRIFDSDRGPYSSDGGVFIEFTGVLVNSGQKEDGFETEYDTDPRPGKIGRTTYELIYRIPANRQEIIQEIKFTVEENNFGPISTAYMALYLPGFKEKSVSWVSNPELMHKSDGLSLRDVSLNKYFRNTAVKKVYFYDIPYTKHPERKYAAQTPEGRGRIACIGSPENYINYICGYPTNDFIPKEAYREYILEISDNQTLPKYGKFQSLNYKLINSPNKSITLTKGQSFMMIMRYKLIDASRAAAAIKGRDKNS